MALNKKSIDILDNLNVKNLSKEHMEIIKDMFEVSSYILSQLEIEKGNDSYQGIDRGEA